MERYEYKVVTAPRRGQKARGVKTAEDRFSLALETAINALAAEGWEYLRAELLPQDERSGLTGTQTLWRNVLVFRRTLPREAGSEDTTPVRHARVEPLPPAPVAAAPGDTPTAPAARPHAAPVAADSAFDADPKLSPAVAEATEPDDEPDDEIDEAIEANDADDRKPASGIDRLMRRRLRRPPDMTRD